MKAQNPKPAKNAKNTLSRRQFLGATAATTAFTIVSPHVLGGNERTSPSEKVNLAFIGVGGQASANINELRDLGVNFVAFSDVDDERAAETYNEFPNVKRYRDFRIMLDKHDKDIDAVVVTVPDHNHAVAAMTAIKMGKHVYCEKPLTRTIHEAREIAKATKKYGVATQMGNQGMAFEGNRLINEWIADGAIGNVHEVHAWSDRPTDRGNKPLYWAQGIERPTGTPPISSTLDWDIWLGPAPRRPYHPAYVPFTWRGWWDFGSGGLGDMGIHNLAPVFSALKLTTPTSVHSSSTVVYEETLPLASTVHYEFGARENMPPVTLHWYDGGIMPPRPKELEDERQLPRDDGVIFVGDKGKMLVTGWGGHSPRIIPEEKMKAYKRPPKTLPRSIGHHAEWLKACKEGTKTRSSFDFAAPLTEALLLGTISVRMGGAKLYWDSKKMKITNLPEANNYLHYEYRKGWTL